MAVQKQTISIPLQQGIDTKESPSLVENAKFTALTNAVFDRTAKGELHKRSGYTAITQTTVAGNSLGTPANTLAAYNNELLCVTGKVGTEGSNVYGYGSNLNTWTPKGNLYKANTVSEVFIEGNSTSVQQSDIATAAGLKLYGWLQDGTLYFKLVDAVTQTAYINTTSQASNVSSFRCVATSTYLYIIYMVSGAMYYISINSAATQSYTSGNVTNGGVTLSTTCNLDACIVNNTYLVIAASTAGGATVVYLYTLASGWTASDSATVHANAATLVSIASQGTNASCFVAYTIFTSPSSYVTYSRFLATPNLASGTEETIRTSAYPVVRMASNNSTASATDQILILEETHSSTYTRLLAVDVDFYTGVKSVNYVGADNVSLASTPLYLATDTIYFYAVFNSTVQPTLFLFFYNTIANHPTLVGKYYVDKAALPQALNALPRFAPLGNNQYSIVSTPALVLDSVADTLVPIYGVSDLTVDLTQSRVDNAQIGQNTLFTAGGLLSAYDGESIQEQGFNIYPEKPTLTYLTSRLSIIADVYSPSQNGSSLDSWSIYIPDNPTTPGGSVGSYINSGEYFTINAVSQATTSTPTSLKKILFWFSVDGGGTAPTGANFNFDYTQVISIKSSFTAIQVANAIFGQVSGYAVSGNYTAAYTVNPQTSAYTFQRITVTAVDTTNALSQMSMNQSFLAYQTNISVPIGTPYAVSCALNCSTGNLIQPSQYLTFWFPNATYNLVEYYLWFTVNGVGVDPSIGSATGIKVAVIGNETADALAVLVKDAVNGVIPTQVTATSNANTVWIQSLHNSTSGAIVSTAQELNNPVIDGVAQNAIGAVVDNVEGVVSIEYVATFGRYDSAGQWWESAPSVPTIAYIPVYVSSPGTVNAPVAPNAVIQVGVTPLYISQTTLTDTEILIYRTVSDQTDLYMITPPNNPLMNVPTGSLLTYVDYNSDASILSNQPIYTTGGVLENDSTPACNICAVHQDRLWVGGMEDPQLLWYSKEFVNGLGLNFSQYLTIRLNSTVGNVSCGPIVGLASLDGSLIVFQQNAIWFMVGDGPDATGGNGQFTLPQLIASSTAIGCAFPGSIITLPAGILFKSTGGWYLLDRSMTLSYIGAPVVAYDADNITKASVLTNSNQVILLSDTGTTLIYDWYYNSWGTFSNHAGTDAIVPTIPGFSFVYINVTNNTLMSASSVYADAGTPYPMSLTSAWIKLNGVQGFQVLWWAYLKGYFPSNFSYTVQVAYNYDPTIVDTFTYTPPITSAASYQFRFNPSKKHIESFQFTVTEAAPYSGNGTWSLDALDLEIGVRTGLFKNLGGSNSVG